MRFLLLSYRFLDLRLQPQLNRSASVQHTLSWMYIQGKDFAWEKGEPTVLGAKREEA